MSKATAVRRRSSRERIRETTRKGGQHSWRRDDESAARLRSGVSLSTPIAQNLRLSATEAVAPRGVTFRHRYLLPDE